MEFVKTCLLTNYFAETLEFYQNTLAFNIQNKTATTFELVTGKSIIEFKESNLEEAPYYHFAFDIPTGSFKEAKTWLEQRVILLTENGEDQISFDAWDSSSIYFEDPSGNIVEFIERRKTSPTSSDKFSASSLLRVSEMSLTVTDKLTVAEELSKEKLQGMNGSEITSDGLSFVSDEDNKVIILLVNPGRKWLFSERLARIFPQEIILDSGITIKINDQNHFELIS